MLDDPLGESFPSMLRQHVERSERQVRVSQDPGGGFSYGRVGLGGQGGDRGVGEERGDVVCRTRDLGCCNDLPSQGKGPSLVSPFGKFWAEG